MMYAEVYRGSGRFTSRRTDTPTVMDNGEVAPNYVYVGHMTDDEFSREFEWQQHDQCHEPQRADWSCTHCQAAGWIS